LKVLHDGAFISPGGTSERLGLVYGEFDASTAGGVHGEAGEGEDIKSVLISADEFIARSKDGRIKDLKSLTLAFWFAAHRDELKDENAAAPVQKPVDSKITDQFAPVKSNTPQAKIIDRTALYEGAFKIESLTIEMDKHEGGTQTLKRLNFDRGNSVAMLGYDAARDEVVLVNEFRAGALAAGANAYNDAVPAAILKDGENATSAAVKQMQRKTGLDFTGAQVIHNGVYSSSGGSSEKIALVVGAVDSSKAGGVHGDPAKQDDILTVVMKADDFIDRAEKGQLTDMKTMAMAFWLANNRAALQKKAADAAAPHKNVGKDAASRRIAGLG
jgi:ADP-ribose pyrophosphatase